MGRNAPSRLSVLRLGHRRDRDKRITSHLGLTARAFGADEVVLAGDRDPSALETWDSVTEDLEGTSRADSRKAHFRGSDVSPSPVKQL